MIAPAIIAAQVAAVTSARTAISHWTKDEFIEKHCQMCGSQRCEGPGTEMFDGCIYANELSEENET